MNVFSCMLLGIFSVYRESAKSAKGRKLISMIHFVQ